MRVGGVNGVFGLALFLLIEKAGESFAAASISCKEVQAPTKHPHAPGQGERTIFAGKPCIYRQSLVGIMASCGAIFVAAAIRNDFDFSKKKQSFIMEHGSLDLIITVLAFILFYLIYSNFNFNFNFLVFLSSVFSKRSLLFSSDKLE